MWNPVHLDGRSLVILQQRNSILRGFTVIDSGRLEYDGQVLRLIGRGTPRIIGEAELKSFMPVTAQNTMRVCRGFDFFLMQPKE